MDPVNETRQNAPETLSVPRRNRSLRTVTGLIVLSLGVTLIVVMLFGSARTNLAPPVVSLVSIEPAGIFDDAGEELRLATFQLTNPNNRSVIIEGRLACSLSAGQAHRWLTAIPHGTETCHFRFKYTGSSIVFKGRLLKASAGWLARHVPRALARRLPRRFWLWVGRDYYGPSADWQEMDVELAVPPKSSAESSSDP